MLKKIPVEQLRVGMYLQSLCGSWIDHPFWRSKFIITDPRDITLIQHSGISEVWINLDKGSDVDAESSLEHQQTVYPPPGANLEATLAVATPIVKVRPKASSMNDEIQRAAKICARAKKSVQSMFEETRMGKAISVDHAGEIVQDISYSVMRNPNALISLARLKTADDYTYMHSVAVCALMVALSHHLNLDDEQTHEAGLAGLLHDLGKAVTPSEILLKPGKLTKEEFAIMKTHPQEGYRLLTENGFHHAVTLDVVLHHHERIDGSGYPHGLAGNEISLFAKMGAVCDVYDAITSNRPYKAGWEPVESIQRMSEWCEAQYDKDVFQAFVSSVGIYPVGSLVRLSSGRLAVVLEQSKSLVEPKVKIFFSTKSKTYITPQIVDLSRPTMDCKGEKIVAHEDVSKWAFKNFNDMWVG
jgi:putative nucleotidyltransferase with HDIG domain